MRHGTLQLGVLALSLLAFVLHLGRGVCAPIGSILRIGLGLGLVDMDDDLLRVRGRRRVQIGKCWRNGVDEFLDIV